MRRILVATTNLHKLREIRSFFPQNSFQWLTLNDFPKVVLKEAGETFMANALSKARVARSLVKNEACVLADDSGLECEDLKGVPGVHSARFAGDQASDVDNNRKLVEMMRLVHDPSRRARYVCALVFIDENGHEEQFSESCTGLITMTPSGTGGFGYDPYFYIPDRKKTMAELSLAEKNEISHRGKALARLRKFLATASASA